MPRLSGPIRFRRGLNSASLLLAPLPGLATAVVAPPFSSNLTAGLALISARSSPALSRKQQRGSCSSPACWASSTCSASAALSSATSAA
jgi:hypothetical protein